MLPYQVSFERSRVGRDGFLVGYIQTAVLGAHSFTMTNTVEGIFGLRTSLCDNVLCLLETRRVRLQVH